MLQFTAVCIEPLTAADMATLKSMSAKPVLTPSGPVAVKVIELGCTLSVKVVPAPPPGAGFCTWRLSVPVASLATGTCTVAWL